MVIDTSIFIDFLWARDKQSTRLFNLPDTQHSLSAVTMFELQLDATSAAKKNDILLLTDGLDILPFTNEIALKASQIYHELRAVNQMIEFRDIFIAATSIIHELPLATLKLNTFQELTTYN
jgi:tRNA(fMet)-specific endonuclease VapC